MAAPKGMGLALALGIGLFALAQAGKGKGKGTTEPTGPAPAGGWTKKQCVSKWAGFLARQFDDEVDPVKLASFAAMYREWGWEDAAVCAEKRIPEVQSGGTITSCYSIIHPHLIEDFPDTPEGVRENAQMARGWGQPEIGACLDKYADELSLAV